MSDQSWSTIIRKGIYLGTNFTPDRTFHTDGRWLDEDDQESIIQKVMIRELLNDEIEDVMTV